MSEATYEYTPSGSDQSEADLLLLWQDRFCDPLTIAITSWAANITDSAHGKATSNALYQGWRGTSFPTTSIPAEAFTGSFGETLLEGLRDGEEPEVVWFQPTEMATGGPVLPFVTVEGKRVQAAPGVGFKVSCLVKSVVVNEVTGLTMSEERTPTIGWVVPDKVPHALDTHSFLRAMKGHWASLRRFRSSQVERTDEVLSEEAALEFASRLA